VPDRPGYFIQPTIVKDMSSSRERAKEIALQPEAGTVYINKHADIAPHIPQAGAKSSVLGERKRENVERANCPATPGHRALGVYHRHGQCNALFRGTSKITL
jgi:hypothetical protein